MPEDQIARLSARYVRFADEEARGRSPLYEALARSLAADREVLAFLTTLPAAKQQPNLLLATMRLHFGVLDGWNRFREALLANTPAIRMAILSRSTQTNEPARCATLLPVLAQLPQPLALLEVGASAGLCLLPDHYGYDFGRISLQPVIRVAPAPLFRCDIDAGTPVPTAIPRIVWRAGLDIDPPDIADPERRRWLDLLVWPEQTHRLEALRLSLQIADAVRPQVVRGDLRNETFEQLCRQAPTEATLVVFHTAVLGYVSDSAERQAFASRALQAADVWISNEAPRVFPESARTAHAAGPTGNFLMSVNGTAVAWADPHGESLQWIGGDCPAIGRRRP